MIFHGAEMRNMAERIDRTGDVLRCSRILPKHDEDFLVRHIPAGLQDAVMDQGGNQAVIFDALRHILLDATDLLAAIDLGLVELENQATDLARLSRTHNLKWDHREIEVVC